MDTQTDSDRTNKQASIAEMIMVVDTIKTSLELLLVLTDEPQKFLEEINHLLETQRDKLSEDKKAVFKSLLDKRQDELIGLIKKTSED